MNGIARSLPKLELVHPPIDPLAGVLCRRCRDRGYRVQPSPDNAGEFVHGPCPEPGCEAGKIARQRQEQARIDALFADSGLPEMYRRASLEDFAGEPELVTRVEGALASDRGLILWGNYGTGKTHLAAAVMRLKLADGTAGLFVKTPALLNKLRSTFDRDAEGPRAVDLLAAVKRAPLLILDDLGAEKPSEWTLETLYEIVDARYCDCLPIVATTNLEAGALRKQLGPRIASRLAQVAEWIAMNGEDRRLGR